MTDQAPLPDVVPVDDDELERYIHYLQCCIVDDGSAAVVDHAHFRSWLEQSRERLEQIATNGLTTDAGSLVRKLELEASEFVPCRKFDSFSSRVIFTEVLDDVRLAAKALGIEPKGAVVWADSPSNAITPMARSSAQHILFAGAGTYSFCNYWGKAFSALLGELSQVVAPELLYDVDLPAILQEHRHLLALPAALAGYFAVAGTTLGFGGVQQHSRVANYRTELVRAMEVFSVGHEFGHFLVEEKRDGGLEIVAFQEEFAADAYGYAISRQFGSNTQNWSAYTGAAASLFFHSVMICAQARDVASGRTRSSETHPPTEQRLGALLRLINEHPNPEERDRVLSYVRECHVVADATNVAIMALLERVMR